MADTVDLSRFERLADAQEKGIELELLDEAGAAIGLKLVVYGPDSERARSSLKAVAKEFADKAEAAGTLAPAGDDADERMVAYLSKIVGGWSPNPSIGGKAVVFSEENARVFFSRFRIFREQAEFVALRRLPFAKG